MYPITSAAKALFESEQRKVLRITGTDGNGTPITLDDSDIVEGSFSIDRYACNGTKLEIGTAISSELSLKLDNVDGRFDDVVFEGMELFVEIGIADWSQSNPQINWIPCGYFTPYDQPRRLSIISLKALDRMTRFDVVEAAGVAPWTTNTGAEVQTSNTGKTIYFAYDLNLPATLQQFITQCANRMEVPFTQDISGFPNADAVIAELPVLQQDITFRNLIQWSAGLMATNAWIDWNGELRFSWYDNTTDYVSTQVNRFTSDLYETPVEITGVRFKDDDEERTVYLAGSDDYSLDVSDNCFINPDNATAILNNIYEKVHSFAYTPFGASVVSAPYLWPMDRVVFTDKNGDGHVSLLTNVNFCLNGTTEIKAIGETAEMNSYASTGAFTTRQAKVLENIVGVSADDLQEAVEHATEMITGGLGGYVVLDVNEETGQTEELLIMDTPDKNTAVNVWRFNQGGLGHSSNGYDGPFNDVALTADGRINATMITTGTMSANRVRAGVITDNTGKNYWNLDTGEFTMTDGTIDIGDFEVDSNGMLTCVGANISGELHTTDGAKTYYIDIQDGEIRAGKLSDGGNTKTESGAISFVDVPISLGRHRPGMLLHARELLMETYEGEINIKSYQDMHIEAGNNRYLYLGSRSNDVEIQGNTITLWADNIRFNKPYGSGTISGTGMTAEGWTWGANEGAVYLRFVQGLLVNKIYGPAWTTY